MAKDYGRNAVLVALAVCSAVSPAWSQQPAGEPAPTPPADSPFLREPQTPGDLLDAVVILVRLGRPEAARYYLERLLQLDLDRATLVALRDRQGPGELVRLAQIRELRPLSVQLLERANAAARAQATDPARIGGMIELLSRSPNERARAVAELQVAGAAAVPHLLTVLQNDQRRSEHDEVLYALVHLGADAVPPLVAGLDADDPRLQGMVMLALGEIGDAEAVPHLWRFIDRPDVPPAVRRRAREAVGRLTGQAPEALPYAAEPLRAEAERYYRLGAAALGAQRGQIVRLWRWDLSERVPVPYELPADRAARQRGIEFARAALRLRPDDRRAQVVLAILMVELEYARVGIDRPLPQGPGTARDRMLAAGPQLATAVLRRALDDRRTAAALGAARVLGQIGEPSAALGGTAEPTPLVRALDYPDPRVQFAAAEAVLQLRPAQPFAGSHRVVQVLARALRTEGVGKALVADAQVDRALRFGALLAQLGYKAEVAVTGRSAFYHAARSADYELIALDPMLPDPELSETLANLRADSRTAAIPVLLVGPLDLQSILAAYEQRYPRVVFVVRPTDANDLRAQIEPLLTQWQVQPLTDAERRANARGALDWLVRIARGELAVFDATGAEDSLAGALADPELATGALAALAMLPTASSQQRLADVVLDAGRPAEVRLRAAESLCESLRQGGAALSGRQISALGRLHETTGEPRFHAALSAVIGCLATDSADAPERLGPYRAEAPAEEDSAGPSGRDSAAGNGPADAL